MLLPVPISRYLSRLESLNRLRSRFETARHDNDQQPSLPSRLLDVFLRTWDLGFTAFGGPPVHFQILHARFVDGHGGKEKWVDEQTVRASIPVLLLICMLELLTVIVPRALRNLPGPTRTRKHEDDILSGFITRRLSSSTSRVFRLEVSSCIFLYSRYSILTRPVSPAQSECTPSPSASNKSTKPSPHPSTPSSPASTQQQSA